jgi:sulfatase modifying factor 1
MGGSALTHCGGPSETTGGESCCTSLEVPGGTFDRRFTNTGAGPTGESDPATVSGYRLDKYLVTVGRFRQFVAAWNGGSGYLPTAGSGKHAHVNGGNGLIAAGTTAPYETGWLATDDANVAPDAVNLNCGEHATWTTAAGNNENLAMNCVDWAEAYAFCIWDGGFLPTEVEWEYAAAGGSQQREYPWGSDDPSMSGAYATYQCNYPPGTGSCMTTLVNIAPVGTATQGAGLWRQLDLVGNMYAWGLDWYFATYTDPCVDCAYLNPTSDGRVLKGASFETLETEALLTTVRSDALPDERADDDGFRCARAP